MFEVIDGSVYHIHGATPDECVQAAANFYSSGGHENDVVALHGIANETIYASLRDMELKELNKDCHLYLTRRIFKDARKNKNLLRGGIVPVLDAFENPVCLLRVTKSVLFVYDYDNFNQPPDTRVFSLYDNVVLEGVTEASFILLKDALADYPGRVVCVGAGWDVFRRLFPESGRVEYFRDASLLPGEIRGGVGRCT